MATSEAAAASRASRGLVHTSVSGGGGVQLHVVETGNPGGRPILFIHGFSQCWLSWRPQMDSDPFAVSYGAIVILDYVRKYGESAIGGTCFVDAITKLGSEAALSVLTPELLNLVPGLFSADVQESADTVQSFLRLVVDQQQSEEDMYLMLGYNLAVSPHVRQALFSRSFDNDDLLPKLRKPVLVMHGEQDAIVKPSIVEQHLASMPHAEVRMIANAGHAPFLDQPERFNAAIRDFCGTL